MHCCCISASLAYTSAFDNVPNHPISLIAAIWHLMMQASRRRAEFGHIGLSTSDYPKIGWQQRVKPHWIASLHFSSPGVIVCLSPAKMSNFFLIHIQLSCPKISVSQVCNNFFEKCITQLLIPVSWGHVFVLASLFSPVLEQNQLFRIAVECTLRLWFYKFIVLHFF